MRKTISLLLAAALCLSLLAACGQDAGGQESAPGEETQPQETQTTGSEAPEPTGGADTNLLDLEEYLWDVPEDASLEEQIKLELRNYSIIQGMELLFEEESYSAYSSAATKLRSKGDQERLDAVREAKAGLVQVTSVAEGVYFIWKDFVSMPIADGESYTEEELDGASLLGYGNTTILVKCLLDDPTEAKGNILVVSGGAMKGRSNNAEGYPAVEVFNGLGYNCFVLQRRLEPYSTIDIYMDCQRAIRTIRYYAGQEGWGGQDMIAAVGWSGGGATILGAINNCYGDLTPAEYDSDYVPDEIDAVNSDLDVAMIIYGAYNHDAEDGGANELLGQDNTSLPAFYINHGTGDETIPYENAVSLYNTVIERGGTAKLTTVEGAPHGYGVGMEGYPGTYEWPAEADEFMQSLRG